MNIFANEKYKHFQTIWTQFDDIAFIFGMAIGLWLFVFHVMVSIAPAQTHGTGSVPELEKDFSALLLVLGSLGIYAASFLTIVPLEVAALVVVGVSFIQSQAHLANLKSWIDNNLKPENLKPKQITYTALSLIVLLLFVITQEVDSMQQEADYVVDGFLLFTLALMWITQPSHLRYRDNWAVLSIVFCIKTVYFLDHQSSQNFKTDQELTDMRDWL